MLRFDLCDMNDLSSPKDLNDFSAVYNMFTNDGWVLSKDEDSDDVDSYQRIEIKDLLKTPDATRFIPKVVTQVVREAVEPNLVVIPNLFQEIQMEAGRMIELGAIGAIYAAEIPEGTEYPERIPDVEGGDMVSIAVSKHGLKISVTEELLVDSSWDVLNMWLRAAGRALARHKEVKAIKLLNVMGTTIINNSVAGGASALDGELGPCTGRDVLGVFNGTMTLNDLFDMYTWGAVRGFTPDTLLMHPLSWGMFATDPLIREVMFNGTTLVSRAAPNGGPNQNWAPGHGGKGYVTSPFGTSTAASGSGTSTTKTWQVDPFTNELNPLNATFQIAPKGLPSPLTVLISPLVPFSASVTGVLRPSASVIMCDSSACGILVTREGISLDEWDDPSRDIKNMKIKERYGFGVMEQGRGVMTAKNVIIDRNFVFENRNSISVTYTDPTGTTPTGATY